jgi:hypothetical protein
MENISGFNKNIAVLYEKDSSLDKKAAIRELLACDNVGLEIVKRFVVDRSNRVSVRLLALTELWQSPQAEQEWIINILEDEAEYLFLQQDFLDFLAKHHEDEWLKKLTQSHNQQLKYEASQVFSGKLKDRIADIHRSLDPYKQSLAQEHQRLEGLAKRLEVEEVEEKYLYQQIAAINLKIQAVQERKNTLQGEIYDQQAIVDQCRVALQIIEQEKQREIDDVQLKMKDLSATIEHLNLMPI